MLEPTLFFGEPVLIDAKTGKLAKYPLVVDVEFPEEDKVKLILETLGDEKERYELTVNCVDLKLRKLPIEIAEKIKENCRRFFY